MNVCVISNSHGASLKNGWDSIKSEYPDVNITFFAVANKGMAKVRAVVGERRFTSKDLKVREMLSYTSGGLESIEVANYDAFLVHGMFLILPRLDKRLSEAVKRASIEETISGSMNFRFVKDLSQMTSVPIFYSSNPLLADDFGESSESSTYHGFKEITEWVSAYYSYLPARQISQPAETLGGKMTTDRNYSVGSVRLKLQENGEQHAETDIRHMNSEFGAALIAQSLLPLLNDLTSSKFERRELNSS